MIFHISWLLIPPSKAELLSNPWWPLGTFIGDLLREESEWNDRDPILRKSSDLRNFLRR